MHNECGKVGVFRVENAEKCGKIGFCRGIYNVENAVEKWKMKNVKLLRGANVVCARLRRRTLLR